MIRSLTLLLVFLLPASLLRAQVGTDSLLAPVADSLKPATQQGLVQIAVDPRAGFRNLFLGGGASPAAGTYRLAPQAASFVKDYMDVHAKRLERMRSTARPYFNVIDNIMRRSGLPAELKYLAVIESNLNMNAVSWAGAVGPWQFMPGTARDFGLHVNGYSDERTNFTKSTYAAARYLAYLYSLYGDWLLVIAAYNGGPGNVNSAIRRSGSRNFWQLQWHLPAESRNHVKKFIATHYIMEGNVGVTAVTKAERMAGPQKPSLAPRPDSAAGVDEMLIAGRYNGLVICEFVGIPPSEFHRLNPAFEQTLSTTGQYNLRLPPDDMIQFIIKRSQIQEQTVRLLLIRAQGG